MSRRTGELKLEVGVAYKKGSRYFLAVDERSLLSFYHGRPRVVTPQSKYEVVRQISVEDLCVRWGITVPELDEATKPYLAPSPEGIKPRPRGSRRDRRAEEEIWRALRLIRLAG